MKKEFNKLELDHKPNWDKEGNWNKIRENISLDKKKRSKLLFWWQAAAAILFLITGWFLGFQWQYKNDERPLSETKEIVIHDTITKLLIKHDTLYVPKPLRINPANLVAENILPKRDTLFVKQTIEILRDTVFLTKEPDPDKDNPQKTEKQRIILNYAEFVSYGKVAPETILSFEALNRLSAPAPTSVNDVLVVFKIKN